MRKGKKKKSKRGGTSGPLFSSALLLYSSWGCGNSQVRDKILSPPTVLLVVSARGDISSVLLRRKRKLALIRLRFSSFASLLAFFCFSFFLVSVPTSETAPCDKTFFLVKLLPF